MASTNRTTHYDLSQYVANDKPTYLVDYNQDMAKIDAGIYSAESKALVNEGAIGDITDLETTVKTDLVSAINEVKAEADDNKGDITNLNTSVSANTGNIGTMANLQTTDKTNLVSAVNELKGVNDTQNTNIAKNTANIENFNLTTFNTYDNASQYQLSNATFNQANVTVAKNSDGSLCKVYGSLLINDVAQATAPSVKLNVDTGLRPQSAITINPIGLVIYPDSVTTPMNEFQPASITINTDGTINIGLSSNYSGGNTRARVLLYPVLIFVKDFGDIPANN